MTIDGVYQKTLFRNIKSGYTFFQFKGLKYDEDGENFYNCRGVIPNYAGSGHHQRPVRPAHPTAGSYPLQHDGKAVCPPPAQRGRHDAERCAAEVGGHPLLWAEQALEAWIYGGIERVL